MVKARKQDIRACMEDGTEGANDTVNGSSGSGNPVGSMSVFDVFAGQRAGYLWNSDWGLADLQAITTDNTQDIEYLHTLV